MRTEALIDDLLKLQWERGRHAARTSEPTNHDLADRFTRSTVALKDYVASLEAALRRSRGVIADMIKAEDERNEAASKCCDEGLIDRDCADDCPQDDTCDCPGTALIGLAINRRNFHEGDCLRAIDYVLAPVER